jgi:hypothetical protein
MLLQLMTSNFGAFKGNLTGASGVGYKLLSYDNTVVQPRTTTGVYQVTGSSGMYAAWVSFPDYFHGSIVWDTGDVPILHAVEQFNYETANPNVDILTGSVNELSSSMSLCCSELSSSIANVYNLSLEISSSIANLSSSTFPIDLLLEISSSVSNLSSSMSDCCNFISNSFAAMSGTLAAHGAILQFLYDIDDGRWKLDRNTNQMYFYKNDNTTLIATFDLFDIDGNPTIDLVTERRRV